MVNKREGLRDAPPLLFLASWRPRTWNLNRDTFLEMATCVVTETICKVRVV